MNLDWKSINVLVFGAGISGISASEVLADLGSSVTLADGNSREKIKLDLVCLDGRASLEFQRQDEDLLKGKNLVVLSPGISIYHPLIEAAQQKGIPVWSEVELAWHLCRCKMLAVTGTNGKTTTTSLLGEMVKSVWKDTVVGGNIGVALSKEVGQLQTEGRVVAEISSFQLEAVHSFRPQVAVILNLTPDHLDRHRSMEEYGKVKERIFGKQMSGDWLVLNLDDPRVSEMSKRSHSGVAYFSRINPVETGSFLSTDRKIMLKMGSRVETVCSVSEMKLFGAHNIENALAASAAAWLAGVPAAKIANVLKTFPGVEHRIEPVATVQGIPYFNDSKATNPESTVKALEAFSGNLILIAGGRDKKTSLEEMIKLVTEKVDMMILIGEASERFALAAHSAGFSNVRFADTIKDAVNIAHDIAKPPQIVLLSPACASYDMFDNYEQRGRQFKELVHRLAR